MKRYYAIIVSLLLLSCEKEIYLNGTIWIKDDGSIQLDFMSSTCLCTHHPGDFVLEKSAIYQYVYNYPDISMYVARSTGMFDYLGTVSKKKLTLIPQIQIFSQDSSYFIDGEVEIYNRK